MGPVVTVHLRSVLRVGEVERLDAWIHEIGRQITRTETGWDFHLAEGERLEGHDPIDCHGPLGVHINPFGKEWNGKEYFDVFDEGDADRYADLLGFLPHQSVSMWAGCNGARDHLALGRMALWVSEQFAGIVDFGGGITPRDAGGMHLSWHHVSVEVIGEIEAFVSSFPGCAYSDYDEFEGVCHVSHLVDATFMRAWINHPYFYLIK